jgi:uncharacterized protein (TIGR00297 family)
MSVLLYLALALIVNLVGAGGAFWKRALTADGALTAFLLGFGIFTLGGPGAWILLMTFFISSTLLGRLTPERAEVPASMQVRGNRRDSIQVLANGGVALLTSFAWALTAEAVWLVALGASLASATADTWASEIGVGSRKSPVSLIGFREVPIGASGGVSPRGTLGALAGALFLTAVFWVVTDAMAAVRLPAVALGIVFLAGFVGNVADSLFGATIQAHYVDEHGNYTERRHGAEGRNRLVRGAPAVTNDVVNVLASVSAAAMAAAAYLLITDLPSG